MRRTFIILMLISLVCAGSRASVTAAQSVDRDVIAAERGALDRWIKGDPGGFLDIYADDVTYFDPMQERRIDGRAAMRALLDSVRGKISIHRFEMVNPKVQLHGDIAVLSYNLVNYEKLPDGSERPSTRWNSTTVFRRAGGAWRTIHSHWSFTKPDLKR